MISGLGKQFIAFQNGTCAPSAPPNERQEGRVLPLPPSPASMMLNKAGSGLNLSKILLFLL